MAEQHIKVHDVMNLFFQLTECEKELKKLDKEHKRKEDSPYWEDIPYYEFMENHILLLKQDIEEALSKYNLDKDLVEQMVLFLRLNYEES